jgi:hypothetical protein
MWELVAREHIRDTLARYNWSGDAGRLDDLADQASQGVDRLGGSGLGHGSWNSGPLKGGNGPPLPSKE